MEKNIKKRVCRLAAVLSAGLVVLLGYWFFLNPHGYWQKKKEAEKNEYMEKQMLWRKSEKMTMQQMLSDMTLMAKGDSVYRYAGIVRIEVIFLSGKYAYCILSSI